jgi:hypothetical protein
VLTVDEILRDKVLEITGIDTAAGSEGTVFCSTVLQCVEISVVNS